TRSTRDWSSDVCSSDLSAWGTSSMSDSEMPFQPLIEEPSKPSPLSNADSSSEVSGMVTCCHVPSRSQNLRSTIFARVCPAHSSRSEERRGGKERRYTGG